MITRLALRNLRAHRLRTLVVGGLLTVGTVVGPHVAGEVRAVADTIGADHRPTEVTEHVLAGLDDAAFRIKFSGSPIKRIGRERFVRNVLYAIGNSGDAGLIRAALALTGDEDSTVADAARWAVERLR